MKFLCKGLCDTLKPIETFVSISRYDQGQKYCSGCAQFVVSDETRCPCCKCMLRLRPRRSRPNNKEERWMNAY